LNNYLIERRKKIETECKRQRDKERAGWGEERREFLEKIRVTRDGRIRKLVDSGIGTRIHDIF